MNIFENPNIFLIVNTALTKIIAFCSKSVWVSVSTEWMQLRYLVKVIAPTIFTSPPHLMRLSVTLKNKIIYSEMTIMGKSYSLPSIRLGR
jgi:hypothetical protein